jgi:hypothetical protein
MGKVAWNGKRKLDIQGNGIQGALQGSLRMRENEKIF